MKAKLIKYDGEGEIINFLFETTFKEATTLGVITGNEVFSIDVFSNEAKAIWRKSEMGGLLPLSIVRTTDADGHYFYRLDTQANKGDFYFPIAEIKED